MSLSSVVAVLLSGWLPCTIQSAEHCNHRYTEDSVVSLLQSGGVPPRNEVTALQTRSRGAAAPSTPYDLLAFPDEKDGGKCLYFVVSDFLKSLLQGISTVCLYTSGVKTFPLQMVPVLDFSILGLGNTTYLGIPLPSLNASNLLPYTVDEYPFLLKWQAELDARILAFAARAKIIQKLTQIGGWVGDVIDYLAGLQMSDVHAKLTSAAEAVNSFSHGRQALPFIQGYGDSWEDNFFAGQLVGNSFIACMLEAVHGGYILDLTESGGGSTALQKLKRRAVSTAPSNLLRAQAIFTESGISLKLTRIHVEGPDGDWKNFSATSAPSQWTLAKMTLFPLVWYVVECFHTGFHLFQATAVAAIRETIPAGTPFGEMIGPFTLQTTFALFEQASLLHSDHDSAFSGSIWGPTNITAIWEMTRDFAHYYFDASMEEILGQRRDSPKWWTGKTDEFIQPIRKFVTATAQQVVHESAGNLPQLQDALLRLGLQTNKSTLDVTTSDGLADFLGKMLFIAVCHSHMYMTREIFSPLMGWTTTDQFWGYLKGTAPWSWQDAVNAEFSSLPETMVQGFVIGYGTSSGFGSKYGGVPELGDGPFPNADDDLQQNVARFQAELRDTREVIFHTFGNFTSGRFVPGYFYPTAMPKPFGFGITQTTYI
mmetsp:Transcript_59930/g.107683  ORF Transcript_59930/g.107683 Transcript_59930/m.107683 type:complete len:652 (+) Transcript_59930:3-1958(+)